MITLLREIGSNAFFTRALARHPPPGSRLFCAYPSFWKNPGSPRQHSASPGRSWTLPSRASRGQLEHPLLWRAPLATSLAQTRPVRLPEPFVGSLSWGRAVAKASEVFLFLSLPFRGAFSASHHTPSSVSWARYLPSLPSTSELTPPDVSFPRP